MDTSLIEEIHNYIQTHFTEQFQSELLGSLVLFDAFDHARAYEPFPDILFDTTRDENEVVRLQFMAAINDGLDYLLQEHRILAFDEVDIGTKNQILSVMYRIQHLEDPVPALRILETDLSDEEQLARIVAEYSVLSEEQILEAVASVDSSTITLMRDYLYQQEAHLKEPDPPSVSKEKTLILENLSDFFAVHGQDNLGYEMLSNGIQPGHVVRLYYPYIHEHLVVDDDRQTAKNLLSFFFLASDTYNDPLPVYRKYSDSLIHDHPKIVRIEALFTQLLNDLRNYQKAKHDAHRVSVIQHPA